ncbi:hypothetical protein BH23GEM5_BH23GEM5_20690 [soil metagenome]
MPRGGTCLVLPAPAGVECPTGEIDEHRDIRAEVRNPLLLNWNGYGPEPQHGLLELKPRFLSRPVQSARASAPLAALVFFLVAPTGV